MLRFTHYLITIRLLTHTIMKNTLKNGLAALIIATSFAACKGNSSATVESVKTDSSTRITLKYSTKKDTSAVPDSLKRDTTITTKQTEVKTNTTEVHKKP
jgi:hypothetical protein